MWAARFIVLWIGLEVGSLAAFTQTADNSKRLGSDAPASPPVPPLPASPIRYFRQLLALSPKELEATLSGKTEAQRTAIKAKLQEYAALPEGERETRLRATELRWYLRPMMELAPTNRTQWLAAVPPDLDRVVRERLVQWDGLTPGMRKEVLENDWIAQYFLRYDSGSPTQRDALLNQSSPALRARVEKEMARWQTLSAEDRRRVFSQFQRFFDLPDREKERTLNRLSETERSQMEKTLQAFEQLPPEQRRLCIKSFNRFAGMSREERVQFLHNAERWKEMTPAERTQWRMLVSQLPPLPPGADQPPMPPGAANRRLGLPPIPVPGRIQLTNAAK